MGLEIIIIAVITSVSCSLLGVFLVLRQMSMTTDAISHTVLLGIVLGFLMIPDLSSPLLIIGAVLVGILTTFLTELLVRSKRVKEDAATGVVFPLLFAIAIIIISLFISDVHMDADAVLLGKLEMASIEQLVLFGKEIGPKSLYMGLFVLIINIVFIIIFYKELKIVSFDSALATILGFSPIIIHYLLMGLVSLTAVTSFSSVGSILVVALMIGPPITALQFTKELKMTLVFSAIIAVFNSVIGYFIAIGLDVTIAGVIATVTLTTFICTLLFAPKKGVITTLIRRYQQKEEFAFLTLVMHLYNHLGATNQNIELSTANIHNELKWNKATLNTRINKGIKLHYFEVNEKIVTLTETGINFYHKKTEELNN